MDFSLAWLMQFPESPVSLGIPGSSLPNCVPMALNYVIGMWMMQQLVLCADWSALFSLDWE